MQLDRLSKKLEGISDASQKGRRVRDLFQMMTNCKELWFEAYANIYSNEGAITMGVNRNTLDGFSEERVDAIIDKLKRKKYKFRPVRRVYIPKHSGKKRPLGILIGDDKLVQEVVRILLERIYEPIFSNHSHGFRPNRSCHTALKQIERVWTGVKWYIEYDIENFFNNMNHEIMVHLLEKRIDDRRLINLIKGMLRAGYLEDWVYCPTYSDTPQGGGVSPILSSVYLHELDTFMEHAIKEFHRGKLKRPNPEYTRLQARKKRVRKKIDLVGKRPELMEEYRELGRIQRTIPSRDPHDEGYRRLRYCRYADDLAMGVIGSREDAIRIMNDTKTFIEGELKLRFAEDKTRIVPARQGMEFLSYKIRSVTTDKVIKVRIHGTYNTKRTVRERVRIEVPDGKAQEFCQKCGYGDWQKMIPIHRNGLMNLSDTEIILVYNCELRGLANYYSLAKDMKFKLNRLEYMSNYSLFKTLAAKHKTRKPQIIGKLRRGNEYIHKYNVKGEDRTLKVFQLKHMTKADNRGDIDRIPSLLYLTLAKNELVKRIDKRQCEYCGRKNVPLTVHHVRKLKDLRTNKALSQWQKAMIARNRKTLTICADCHKLLHAGRLPDKRYHEYA